MRCGLKVLRLRRNGPCFCFPGWRRIAGRGQGAQHLEGGAWDIDARAEREDVGDTIGGLAAVLAGHMSKVGDWIVHDSGWTLEVIAADTRRVLSLPLHPPKPEPEHG